jgi:predicted HAD superfamily phosphohydrolase YqeG
MSDQKQPENVEYFSHLGIMIIYDARCPWEIQSRMAMAKATVSKKQK